MTTWDLNHKRALITGGTKGIGRAAVLEFLALGAEVLFTAHHDDNVRVFEAELRASGLTVTGLRADVAVADEMEATARWIEQHWGALDILVNNAGMNIRKATTDYTSEEYYQIIDVDLLAPFAWSRWLFALLQKGHQPTIVNVASVAGLLDVQTGSPYGMAKAGLLQQTRNLAVEWAVDGIRVNAVSPWFTETPLTTSLLGQPDRLHRVVERTPQKRVAQADEMAAAIAFLAMDKASYIAGQNLIVDGGLTANAL